ncbi:MAG: ATP-dependent helicase [Actinomycetia bacterium]|nr:ATP-dependent helicase [Actinomycetes bacterium]
MFERSSIPHHHGPRPEGDDWGGGIATDWLAPPTLDHLEGLNPAQREAAVHHTGPLLVVAGAGTGKTRTLAARVAHLIHTGTPPERILLLTFTRRAASEMLNRVGSVTDRRAASRVWGGTFHAVANRLLRAAGPSVGLPAGFTVLDQGDTVDLFAMLRTEGGMGEQGRRFPRAETVAAVWSRMVNSQTPLSEVVNRHFPWTADHSDDLRTLFAAYNDRKRRLQVLDYDDLLLHWRALAMNPETTAQLAGRFDHVLVDEYQDTNPIQADILEGMCRQGAIPTAVGDDAQSIYSFRSATVANLWTFPERFPGAHRVTLDQNYRSTSAVLNLANEVLAASNRHLDKQLWSDRGTGSTPTLSVCHDEGDQSRVVADRILDLREQGIDLRDQAVLFRTGHHSDALELELNRRSIPFVKYGGLKFLEAGHVKDVLALLRLLENPADELAWHRVLGLLDGVGPATIRRLLPELGLGDDPAARPDQAVTRLLAGEGRWPRQATEGHHLLRSVLADCLATEPALPLGAQLERLRDFCALVFPLRYDNTSARLSDLDRLTVAAGSATDRSRFLAELTLEPPERTGDWSGPPHLDDDWLTLSTIHSAKGCEWHAVHLLHAADGNLPSEMALSDREGLDEELRLTYVALTRARDHLDVTFPLRYHVNRYGSDDRHHWAQLSRFLEPVRHHFEEQRSPEAAGDGLTLDLRVTVTDEIDTSLTALWEG